MKTGVPKEIKSYENRMAVTPAGVHELVLNGHAIMVQSYGGTGARVTILDISLPRMRHLCRVMPANVVTQYLDNHTVRELSKSADLIVGAVLIAGNKAPQVLIRDMLKDMKPRSVLVDVAIDQSGCFDTSKPTTHKEPVYVVNGVTHYSVANILGALPMTSAMALTNAKLLFVLQVANLGWEKACDKFKDLRKGLNIMKGDVVYKEEADTFSLKDKEY